MSWTDSTLFLRMLIVAFCTFLWPSYQVSGRTWCKHVAPSTHPFHNTTEGQTRLNCRSTHSRLSQAASRSSGMWRQEMLPSILHGCHLDTISSFSFKNLSQIFLSDLVCTVKWKDLEKEAPVAYSQSLPRHSPGGIENTTEYLRQDTWSPTGVGNGTASILSVALRLFNRLKPKLV
jgi:hypothetical protein